MDKQVYTARLCLHLKSNQQVIFDLFLKMSKNRNLESRTRDKVLVPKRLQLLKQDDHPVHPRHQIPMKDLMKLLQSLLDLDMRGVHLLLEEPRRHLPHLNTNDLIPLPEPLRLHNHCSRFNLQMANKNKVNSQCSQVRPATNPFPFIQGPLPFMEMETLLVTMAS